uniref:Uncharacterized protein n=1 Tax=viral metagenome TaxID=1070528 RepID=A0A6C0IYG2_9ZZZZ
MYKSIILANVLCLTITLYIYITNNINKTVYDKSYYIKTYFRIILYSLILLYLNNYIKTFDVNVQEILTGSPEF